MNLYIIANNNFGQGMSGGDRIWTELAKRWQNRAKIAILGSPEGFSRLGRDNHALLTFVQISPISAPKKAYSKSFILKNTLIKTYYGIKYALTHNISEGYIYSVSDFYPDFFPALIFKLKNRKIKWIAGFYLFAPEPWRKDNPYKTYDFIRGLVYWISQKISYPIIKYFADIVFVTSEPDIKKFKKAIAIKGGVSLIPRLENWKKEYEAVFVGRFHQQKGVLELIEIWREVVRRIPYARLVMIGNGDLEEEVRKRRNKYNLHHNIYLTGFSDGALKNSFYMSSKIVVHPATYDSGGMACAEAMAFGLPAVGFDLPAYKTYYPRGMIKVRNNKEFADLICMLLEDKILYHHYSLEARDLIEKEWNWNTKAEEIWTILQSI